MNILPKNPGKVLITIAYVALAFLLLAYVAPRVITWFLPFIVAWIISLIINPIVTLMQKIHIHRRIAVIVSMLLVIALISAAFYFVLVSLAGELSIAVELIQETSENGMPSFVLDIINKLPGDMKNFAMKLAERTEGDIVDFVYPAIKTTLSKMGNVAGRLPSALVFTIAMILATYFISYDGDRIKLLIKQYIPKDKLSHIHTIKEKLSEACGGYIKAQLILMSIVFVILFIGFTILDVKLSFILAVVISIWDAIPVLGTGIILNPWALVNLLQGDYFKAAGFFILYLIILLTRQLLEPKILSGQLGIHPIFTLAAIYIGLKTMGIFGMIIGPILLILAITALKISSETQGGNENVNQ